MSNYNYMIGSKVITDAGEHEIVAHVYDDNCTDSSINLYVGRAAKGYYNLIASNASLWVVGDEDNASRNYDSWVEIGDRYAAARDAIRDVDADLADWLDARRDAASRALRICSARHYESEDATPEVINVSETSIEDAISNHWDDIDTDVVIEQGIGDDKEIYHFAATSRDIPGGDWDVYPDYYLAPYVETGYADRPYDDDADMGNWYFYTSDGKILE